MTLKRQKPKPVDWAKQAQFDVEEESKLWLARTKKAVEVRYTLFMFLEMNCPAKSGVRGPFNNLNWYTGGKKVPWGPMVWRE